MTGWGLAVVYIGDVRPQDIDTAGAYLAGAGLAGVAAALLRRRGFLISEVGFAATGAAGGLTLALTPRAAGTLDDATTVPACGSKTAAVPTSRESVIVLASSAERTPRSKSTT